MEECVDRGVTDEAFGIDLRTDAVPETLKNKFFSANFEEPAPIRGADYVVSVGAVTAFAEHLDLEKVIESAMIDLRADGEMRAFPIQHAPPGSELIGLEESYARWKTILSAMEADHKIRWELRPIDIRVSGNNNDVWLEELLVIKKYFQEKGVAFAALRTDSLAKMRQDLEKRLKENPHPSEHELHIGAFEEEIEPQMREPLRKLYEKGYSTESSGFAGDGGEEVQQIDGYFAIDPDTEKKLRAAGAWITRETIERDHSTLTRVEFRTDEADIQKIVEKWNEIIDILPAIGAPSYSLGAASYEFREKYLGTDTARKIQIETTIARSMIPDDERPQFEEYMRKSGEGEHQ